MSDPGPGRYRKAYPRIWRHPGFRALSRDEQRLVLYLLFGPQTNRIGLYHFSVFTAAEDLDTTPETLKKGLANVTVTFGWTFDAEARVFYIPSWWKWNPPENANVIKGSLKDLNEVPPCGLVSAFATNIELLPDVPDKDGRTLRVTFVECLRERLPQGSLNQYQKQISNKSGTNQEQSALRAAAPSSSKTTNGKAADNGLVLKAKELLKAHNRNDSIDSLCDAFRSYHKDYTTPKADILPALNAALLERRANA